MKQEEREYDEDGEYELTGNEWRTIEKGGVIISYLKQSPITNNSGYYRLWLAVIQQAVNDYRAHPEMRAEVARFFKSDYFESMTCTSGQSILDRLKKEVKQNNI